jgi:transcriptional regulator with XRE-family HTH domain
VEYISRIDLKIAEKLRRSQAYRRAFFKALARDDVALQIKALRKARKLTQKEVADKLGMVPSAIVRIEDPDYAAWTFTTLLRVAEALDACWDLRLRKSEEVIKEVERTQQQKSEAKSKGYKATAISVDLVVVTHPPLLASDRVAYPVVGATGKDSAENIEQLPSKVTNVVSTAPN